MITFAQEAPKKADPAIVQRMAAKIRELGGVDAAEGMTPDDFFHRSDFTDDEIERYGRAAVNLARATAVRKVA